LDFELTEEQRAVREMAQGFTAAELAPHAARWDEEHIFPIEALRRAASLGLAGIYVREGSGGPGLSRLDAAIVFEELATGCTSTAAYISIHNMVAWMIDAFGDDRQRGQYLPRLLAMESFASYCLTEPDAGSDAASLRTTARREGEQYVLNGTKAFTSGAGAAGLYLVMARTGGPGASGISSLLVEGGTPGLGFGAEERKLGWHSQPTRSVTFDDCRVPAGNLLGGEGQGFKIAMRGLDGGRVNIAACSLGAARACLERAIAYAKERRQFGRPIADFQNSQFALAEMATELEAARLLVWRAAAKLDIGDPDTGAACAMAKRFATDIAYQIVDRALQLHGGYGYIRDYGIERYLRDCRVHRILEGTNEIMRVVIARRLLADDQR
jgi:alkylation response protein AidB-like acyl-CoA dehydrogenase